MVDYLKMPTEAKQIFDKITETYQVPIKIGSRCISRVFYRVEYLTEKDISTLAQLIAERIEKVCSPQEADYLISLPGNFTSLGNHLAVALSGRETPLEVIPFADISNKQATREKVKNKNVILVNDVITTARSCLEAHSQTTLARASVLCWAALVDRTFGPGPVAVVAGLTGEPVTLV